jgi:hypothetical protein
MNRLVGAEVCYTSAPPFCPVFTEGFVNALTKLQLSSEWKQPNPPRGLAHAGRRT